MAIKQRMIQCLFVVLMLIPLPVSAWPSLSLPQSFVSAALKSTINYAQEHKKILSGLLIGAGAVWYAMCKAYTTYHDLVKENNDLKIQQTATKKQIEHNNEWEQKYLQEQQAKKDLLKQQESQAEKIKELQEKSNQLHKTNTELTQKNNKLLQACDEKCKELQQLRQENKTISNTCDELNTVQKQLTSKVDALQSKQWTQIAYSAELDGTLKKRIITPRCTRAEKTILFVGVPNTNVSFPDDDLSFALQRWADKHNSSITMLLFSCPILSTKQAIEACTDYLTLWLNKEEYKNYQELWILGYRHGCNALVQALQKLSTQAVRGFLIAPPTEEIVPALKFDMESALKVMKTIYNIHGKYQSSTHLGIIDTKTKRTDNASNLYNLDGSSYYDVRVCNIYPSLAKMSLRGYLAAYLDTLLTLEHVHQHGGEFDWKVREPEVVVREPVVLPVSTTTTTQDDNQPSWYNAMFSWLGTKH